MTESTESHSHSSHSHKKDNSPKLTTGTLVLIQTLLIVIVVFQLFAISGKLDNMGVAAPAAQAAPQAAAAAAAPAAAPTPAAAPAPTPTVQVSADDDAVKGDANAPVTIVEFSDYQCPYCGRFYSQTLSQIQAQYIDTGKVKMVYRDFPLSFHPHAQKAAEAAECAGKQGKYWDMHNKLFENQDSLSVVNYKKWAGELGLNQADFDSCLDSGAMAAEIQKDFTDGQSYGVRGTPAFFINGQLVSGAQPFAAFQQVIDAALAGQ